jgi:hypothetical protein
MELGAWSPVTNGGHGVAGANYRDKGVFVSIPFEGLLPNDTKLVTGFSLAPWTRDRVRWSTRPWTSIKCSRSR